MWSLVSDLLWVLQLLEAVCSSSFLWMIFAVSAGQLHVNENTNLATHDSFRNIWHTWKSVSLPLDFRITSFYNSLNLSLKILIFVLVPVTLNSGKKNYVIFVSFRYCFHLGFVRMSIVMLDFDYVGVLCKLFCIMFKG